MTLMTTSQFFNDANRLRAMARTIAQETKTANAEGMLRLINASFPALNLLADKISAALTAQPALATAAASEFNWVEGSPVDGFFGPAIAAGQTLRNAIFDMIATTPGSVTTSGEKGANWTVAVSTWTPEQRATVVTAADALLAIVDGDYSTI